MNHREQELLHLLLKLEQPVPVSLIAEKLGLSARTIRNYVNDLNGSKPWIQSSRQGLSASAADIEAHLDMPETGDKIPETPQEREFYLIQCLLLRKENPAADEVCENLLISDSTLKSDLIRLNRQYSDQGVRFRMRKGRLEYTGENDQVRSVIQSLIRQETSDQFLHLDLLMQMFGSRMVDKNQQIWSRLLRKWNADENELIMANLILHTTLIAASSTRKKWSSDQRKTLSESSEDRQAELQHALEIAFDIEISKEDQDKLAALCRQCDRSDRISPETADYCKRVKERLERDYFVDLSEESFTELLESHVEQLLKRMKNDSYAENPLTESIRVFSPVVYEMAISAADEFRNCFSARLDEAEIAFLALHIGVHLEFTASLPEIYAICPAYHNLQVRFVDRLKTEFQNEARIVLSNTETLPDNRNTLVVSARPLPKGNYPFLHIDVSPFVSDQDVSHIRQALNRLKTQISEQRHHEHFDLLVSKDLFRICHSDMEVSEIIESMSSLLVNRKLASSSLPESVLEREELCTTAFDGFAIPHPLHPKANKPAISVFLFPEGVSWQDQKVYVVFLLSFREQDQELFREVYEPLITMQLQPGVPQRLAQSPDFDSFRSLVLELMD